MGTMHIQPSSIERNSPSRYSMRRSVRESSVVLVFVVLAWTATAVAAFARLVPLPRTLTHRSTPTTTASTSRLQAKAGSFFNPVPERDDKDEESRKVDENDAVGQLDMQIEDALKVYRQPSKATEPSTINGIPSSGSVKPLTTTSASIRTDPSSSKPYVGVGPASLNDVTNPEYDDQGYTLYANERTGERSRVFEALVEYPCLFTLKVVGANEGDFVRDILVIVATTCQVDNNDPTSIDHAVKHNGRWTSITVKAPVQSAQMLYQLYEDVDRDPRVKFKF